MKSNTLGQAALCVLALVSTAVAQGVKQELQQKLAHGEGVSRQESGGVAAVHVD
jgi:hypothetical protein